MRKTRPSSVRNPLRSAKAAYCRLGLLLLLALCSLASQGQTTLTNGAETAGTLLANATNFYTFNAASGDTILLRMGASAFNPRIVLRDPGGVVIALAGSGASGATDVNLATSATNTGTFSVEASSIYAGGAGSDLLNLARIPGAFVTSPGYAGGPLTNGWKHTGNLSAGEQDMWSFSANAGDRIVLRMGSATFNPWIRLYGPTGVLVGTGGSGASGFLNVDLALAATNSGTFTAVVSSIYGNGMGNYLLCLAQAPGAIFVEPGYAGGPLTNGWQNTGNIALGELDVWSFNANAGDSIVLRMGATNFNPWIRLFGPNGAEVGAAGSGASGFLNVDLALRATNSGSYTVVVSSYGGNNTGSYLLNLAQSPGAIFVTPGYAGGPLTNGWKNYGSLALGELDMWSFNANAGDSIVLRMGATNYNPWVRVFGPNGAEVGTAGSGASGFLNVDLALTATNTGSYTVVVSSFSGNNTGTYLLNLAHSPGVVFVTPGYLGGVLTNGWKYTGSVALGELDVWTIAANAGDTLVLRMAATNYNPWIRLYGPSGGLVAAAGSGVSGALDVDFSVMATNAGIYYVVASSFSGDNIGSYLINLAQIPGEFVIAPGDEGGVLVSGTTQFGTVDVGDMDMWRFGMCRGELVILSCQKVTGTLSPRMRLYGRNGALLASAVNASVATLNYPAPDSGFYTLIVDGGNVNDTGTYALNGNGRADGLNLCPPLVTGTSLTLGGFGGTTNASFILFSSTNVTTPRALWTPILTNQFDHFGVFDVTNTFNPAIPLQFFRLEQQ